MNLCVMDEYKCVTEKHLQLRKGNKWALKLIGVINSDVSYEDFLEFISLYVNPNSIQAFFYDSFNNFYSLFLSDVESFCLLVGKKESMGSYTIKFLPLLDFYVVDNVYPYITNDDLCQTFESFGTVFQVTNYHVLPNSSKFSHILSGKREISFTLPGDISELNIPINVFQSPYRYHVRKLCSACLTEGHSVLHCPDIEEDFKSECCEGDSSGSELSCILKTEVISGLHDSTEEIKEEVISVGEDHSLENRSEDSVIPTLQLETTTAVTYNNADHNSVIPALSLEERAVVSFNDAVPESLIPSAEGHPESSRISDTSLKLVQEDDLKNIEETCSAGDTQGALISKESSNFVNEYSHKNKFKKNLNIPDTICLDSEDTADDCQSGFENKSSENTKEAVASNFPSNFFRGLVHRRQIRETLYSYNTMISNESEESMKSDGGVSSIKRRRLKTKRDSQSADISATERNGHGNGLSPAASERKKHKTVLWKLSREAMEFIDNSVGVLPPQALKDIILCDGRKPSIILDLILAHTLDLEAVDEQLKELYRMYKLSKLSKSIRFQHILSKILQIRQLVLSYE